MASAITQCPKCSTSFRITQAHLKSAKGAVRCGSCLTIFNAKENLVSTEEEATPTNKTETFATTQPNEKKKQPSFDKDELISDDGNATKKDASTESKFEDGLSDNNDEIYFKNKADNSESNLFERNIVDSTEDEIKEEADESWADALLEEEAEESSHFEHNKNNDASTKDVGENRFFDKFKQEASSFSQPSAKSLSDDYAKERLKVQQRQAPPHSEVYSDAYSSKAPSEGGMFQIIEDLKDNSGSSIANQLSNTPHSEAYEDDNDYEQDLVSEILASKAFVSSIEPEPVEFSYSSTQKLWGNSKVMILLIALSLFVLIAQFAWIKFDTLSKVSPYRSYYKVACKIFTCTLPVLIDRNKIKSSNLIVRSHPKKSNILVVDTMLINNAEFEQSFPDLTLVFFDINNKPVAARQLKPKEYLAGELTGRKDIPIKQPIRVGIQMVDPGAEAVSYSIHIAN